MKIHITLYYCLFIVCCASPAQNHSDAEGEAVGRVEMLTSINEDNAHPCPEQTGKAIIGHYLKRHEHLPVEDRIALYHSMRSQCPEAFDFENEDNMTMYGYSLLWRGKAREALEVFKLIVSQFPDSSNPYDSLGEAFLELGNEEEARTNYEISLALDSLNHNARDQIARIDGVYEPQESTSSPFAKIFSVDEYRQDLDELGRRLREIHPNALKFIDETDFMGLIETKKALIHPFTTFGEFVWHCDEIIAAINCSHTSTSDFYQEWDMLPAGLVFPVRVRWQQGEMYLVHSYNHQTGWSPGARILRINDRPVEEIVSDIYRRIPAQGFIETSKRYVFNAYAMGLIPYALGFPDEYEFILENESDPIRIPAGYPRPNDYEPTFASSCAEKVCFEIMSNDSIGLFTLNSFNFYWWNDLDYFTDFVDSIFLELNTRNVANLIIDLRFNGGGSPESSIHVLKYLMDKPFEYFINSSYSLEENLHQPVAEPYRGKLYFLIDGNGESTTGHFMSLVEEHELGPIIGEELGSNRFCTAGQASCRLTNTQFRYYVANATSISSAPSGSDERGILPHHSVSLSIDDYLNGRDIVKNFALALIQD